MNDHQPASTSSTSTSSPKPAATTSADSTSPPANAAAFFAALGNPVRWEAVKLLATSPTMLASTHIAKALHQDFDNTSKHMRILLRAGVVSSTRQGDKRCEWYYLPKNIRRDGNVLDYGWCRIAMQ